MENKSPRIVGVAIPKPLETIFDYLVPTGMTVPSLGCRLRVPFGKGESIGICVETKRESGAKQLREITEVVDNESLVSADLLGIALWMAEYYHHPIGETLFSTIPPDIRKGKPLKLDKPRCWTVNSNKPPKNKAPKQKSLYELIDHRPGISLEEIRAAGFNLNTIQALEKDGRIEAIEPIQNETSRKPIGLNAEQRRALKALNDRGPGYGCFLLDGITGSGKTEVYLQAMESVIRSGMQALVLVPEISLTPQTYQRFANRFPKTGLMHSGISNHNNLQTWLKCKEGKIDCLVGTRSAIFAPFQNLGIIIVDEEHDSSYKQQEGLKYSARDVAVKRASQKKIPIILGSATPSVESINNVQNGKYSLLTLRTKADNTHLPTQQIVDLSNGKIIDGFSSRTIVAITKHLDQQNQVMIFINKRGFARTLFCTSCGWKASCIRCDARTTVHTNPDLLICHYCGWKERLKTQCPECQNPDLISLGQGTQKLESSLGEHFPQTPIFRIDRDSTRSQNQFAKTLKEINTGKPCILVGTQMLSKGHDFKNLTLVVVMEADVGFNAIDFRGPEKSAQQICQVSGRSGRHNDKGEIMLQTYDANNSSLLSLIENGYKSFAEEELQIRKKMRFPPFRPMAIIRADAKSAGTAESFLNRINYELSDYETLGPAPAVISKISNRYRFQLMILAETRNRLDQALNRIQASYKKRGSSGLRWSIDVDPLEI
ncbi:MAG: primosomal protein N' [Candidatus Azotimanducaceae bacterium]